eukprot:12413793-Karenia_brevis.AAC.1
MSVLASKPGQIIKSRNPLVNPLQSFTLPILTSNHAPRALIIRHKIAANKWQRKNTPRVLRLHVDMQHKLIDAMQEGTKVQEGQPTDARGMTMDPEADSQSFLGGPFL